MKNVTKRGLSMLMALVMCLSFLSVVVFPASAATVDYVYNGKYIYNWGSRGTTATFLSPNAIAFYEDNGTSYSELSSYAGSASVSSVPSSEMYQKLQELMVSNHSYTTSYDATKDLFMYTDCQNSGGKISSFYSGNAIGPSWDGNWNREHTWPNSKGLGGQDENDIIMLRPTSTSENSSRGNTAYGESGSYYDPNDASGGQYNLHGDVARLMLYTYVRWGNTSYMWGNSGVMESCAVLLKWMEEDPVDTWELGRNDAVEAITGTRNVFVDYPELVFLMFGAEIPADYTTPSGEGSANNYSITATSNNTSYGTVSLSGRVITATPKTGYYVSGYTVTSGSATVTQNGNTFTVSASSDCTVRIDFAAKTAVTVSFMENGITATTINAYGGDTVTLPSYKSTAVDGYTFVGWTDAVQTDTTTKPTVYAVGSTVPAADKTYYALYTYSVGGTGVTEYTLKDITEISPTDEVVVTMQTSSGTVYALPTDEVEKGPAAVTITASEGKLTETPANNLLWNIGGSANAYIFYPNGETGRWLASAATNNGMSVGTGSGNTFKVAGDYLVSNTTSRYVGVYTSGPDWRCYTSSSTNIGGQTLGLYVKSESGITYYTTTTFICEHGDTIEEEGKAPTCTEPGYTAAVFCFECREYISVATEIPATGHSWGVWVTTTAPTCTVAGVQTHTCSACGEQETQAVAATGHSCTPVVTPPTATEQGYTTYTCSTCGYSYVDDYVDALGETFTVRFSVPAGVSAVADMSCGKSGITLPNAGVPTGEYTYTFQGWAEQTVDNSETKPTIYAAGAAYTAKANTTLYAVYSYTVDGSGSGTGDYVKVTSAPADWSGEYVIVYESAGYIFNGSLTTFDATNNYQEVTISNNTISATEADAYKFTIAKSGSGYSIQGTSGGYIGNSGNSNGLTTGTSAMVNTISLDADGNANIVGSGGAYLRFNANSGQNRFRYYKSSSYSSQKAIALYVKAGAVGTTYYTTQIGQPSVAVYENGQSVGTYATVEEAYAVATAGQYLVLLQDAQVELTLNKDLYIDLNGYVLEGKITAGAYQIHGMDSTTNEYGVTDGYMDCTDASGAALHMDTVFTTDAVMTGESYSYMAIEDDNGWSFHRFYVGVTHVTLKPSVDGIGYKAMFCGSDVIKSVLDEDAAFTITLSLAGGNTVTRSLTAAQLVSGKTITVRLDNYDVANHGQTDLSIQVALGVAGDDAICSDVYTTNLKSVVQTVNANAAKLSADQLAAVATMIGKYAVMQGWDVSNLYTKES